MVRTFFENFFAKEKKRLTTIDCYESQAKDAHVGVVKNYSSPPIPKAPVLPTDIASELAAYDAAEPAIAEVAASTSTSEESGAGGAEAYLAFLEQDIPKPVHHHH